MTPIADTLAFASATLLLRTQTRFWMRRWRASL